MSIRSSAHVKHAIKTERDAVQGLLDKGDDALTTSDFRELKERDGKLESLMTELKEVTAKEERMTSNRQNMQNIFSGNGGSTHDGSAAGISASKAGGRDLSKAIMAAGFNLHERPSVRFDFKSTLPSAETYAPRSSNSIMPTGQDRRFIFPWLPVEGVGTETTSINDFRQTGSRTLTGTVERALDATTDKAEVDLVLESISTELKMVAVVLEDIPNSLLSSLPMAEQWFRTELEYILWQAVDAHVLAQILAASPPSGISGSDQPHQYRNALTAMRAVGSNPDLLVLNPTDSSALDLLQDNSANFIWTNGERSGGFEVWDMRVIETSTGSSPAPILIDSSRIGQLYVGAISLEADMYSGFKKNLTNLRAEMSILMHVRSASGAYRVTA